MTAAETVRIPAAKSPIAVGVLELRIPVAKSPIAVGVLTVRIPVAKSACTQA
jgi:hypothetical protein